MVHVFRNAVEHGIETPDERVDAGKPEAGRIACLADAVVLTIAGDGCCTDPGRPRAWVVLGRCVDVETAAGEGSGLAFRLPLIADPACEEPTP